MRILIDVQGERTRDHAQRLVAAIDAFEMNVKNVHHAKPRGVAFHRTHYPHVCDDCTVTYWTTDPYSGHAGCPGAPPKQKAGFGN